MIPWRHGGLESTRSMWWCYLPQVHWWTSRGSMMRGPWNIYDTTPLLSQEARADLGQGKFAFSLICLRHQWGHDFDISSSRMGHVRTKTTKRASCVLIEKYYLHLTLDIYTNKHILDEVIIVSSERLWNKISGFTTHLLKRIQHCPDCGTSFKLQEEGCE